MAAKPVPEYLGTKATVLWRDITKKFTLRSDELRILEDACREIDLVERLEDELRDSPLQVRGSQGQMVSSPLVSELRQHRVVVKALLGSLKLPDESGEQSGDASSPARRAASARWSNGAA